MKCPRSACFLYSKNSTCGTRPVTKKNLTPTQFKMKILEKMTNYFMLTLSKEKVLEYKDIRKIYRLYIEKYFKKIVIKGDGYKSLSNYNDYLETLEEMLEEDLLKRLIDFWIPGESQGITEGVKVTIDLGGILNKENYRLRLKEKYTYELEIPMYKETSEGMIIYKYNHYGYPNFKHDEDMDLLLTRFIGDRYFEDNIIKLVVIDFSTFSRYEIDCERGKYFANAFKILKTIDLNLVPKYPNIINCKYCRNTIVCDKVNVFDNEIRWFEKNDDKTWKEKTKRKTGKQSKNNKTSNRGR